MTKGGKQLEEQQVGLRLEYIKEIWILLAALQIHQEACSQVSGVALPADPQLAHRYLQCSVCLLYPSPHLVADSPGTPLMVVRVSLCRQLVSTSKKVSLTFQV